MAAEDVGSKIESARGTLCYHQDARLCRLTCVPFEDLLAMIGLSREFHAIISMTLLR